MKKYELTKETIQHCGRTLHRIRALRDFGNVTAGELGGYIEKENNLDHEGDAWVCGNARVYGEAWVCGDARVYGEAWVCGGARVYGNARVYGGVWVGGNARVSGNAQVYGNAQVCGDARVYGDAQVSGDALISQKNHILTVGPMGSRCGITTFQNSDDGILVSCGCFFGGIDEFAKRVEANHGEDRHGKAYRLAIELARVQIGGCE